MPSLLLSPLTGALVDRYDRKKVSELLCEHLECSMLTCTPSIGHDYSRYARCAEHRSDLPSDASRRDSTLVYLRCKCLGIGMFSFVNQCNNQHNLHHTTQIMNSFQYPAFSASVSLLVHKDDLVKYGALSQFTPALSMLLGPAITGEYAACGCE